MQAGKAKHSLMPVFIGTALLPSLSSWEEEGLLLVAGEGSDMVLHGVRDFEIT